MAQTNKLKKLLKVFTPDETSADFKAFDMEVTKLKDNLKEKVQAKTLDDVNVQLDKFRRRINIDPLIEAVKSIEVSINGRYDTLTEELGTKIETLQGVVSRVDTRASLKDLGLEISDLQRELSSLKEARKNDVAELYKNIPNVSDIEDRMDEMSVELSARLDALEEEEPQEIEDWQVKIDVLRRDIMNRISNLGGGSMNRQIVVNGVDPLLKYTDINLKAGANVTITYQSNDTTKKTDITIASSGGGGGSTRMIQSIAVSQTAGSTSGTDYVYLCSGTLTVTMPTTVANTNLYTIKNIGAGIVTIDTTGGETIDGQLTQVMPIQFTSVDLISNNSGDWAIT